MNSKGKILFLLMAAILLFTARGLSQMPCKVHIEEAGMFSFCPPEGWTPTEPDNSPYKSWANPKNTDEDWMFVLISNDTGSFSHKRFLELYSKGQLNELPHPARNLIKLIEFAEFKNENNLVGYRSTYEHKVKGKAVRTVQYSVEIKDKLISFAFSGLETNKAVNDPKFEAMMKTLKAL